MDQGNLGESSPSEYMIKSISKQKVWVIDSDIAYLTNLVYSKLIGEKLPGDGGQQVGNEMVIS